MKGKFTYMKNPELINRENLLADIEVVYKGRYDRSYDQAVHDLYNAIVKRIRRAPNCAAQNHPAVQKEIKCQYLTANGLCKGQKCTPKCHPGDTAYCERKMCNGQ
jgi:hypothetical protein